MKRFFVTLVICILYLPGLVAQDVVLRRYEIKFNDMDFTTIYDCIVDLSEERKQKLFKNLGEGPYRVEFYNSADFNDDSYKKMAQWTMYNNDCNFKDGPYNLDDYTDKGALIVPDDGWGFLTVYNSKGSIMIYIHYSKGKLRSLELIRKSKTLYKAEGRFETEYADGSPFYIFVSGNSVMNKK